MISEQKSLNDKPAEKNFFERPAGRILLFASMFLIIVPLAVAGLCYLHYAPIVARRLKAGPFAGTVSIYTAPRSVAVGDELTADELAARLQRSGYSTSRGNTIGWFNTSARSVSIFPGRDSFAGGEPGLVEFSKGKVSRIVSLGDHTERRALDLEPQLIANLSPNREKRRIKRFTDFPPALVRAVISAEDKHFFHHSGIDILRLAKAAYVDLKEGRKEQGGSTLTMQLARGWWLSPQKEWRRKLEEMLITLQLESRLSKQQIFEDYANQVYLGRQGTFSVNGFGEAARVYFGKDVSQLDVPEAALLAGMIQRPSYFNPYRHPDRARDRRNVVLGFMKENGYLTDAKYREAIAAPLRLQPDRSESGIAPYFVDLMNRELPRVVDEDQEQTRFVYTTLDPDLQQAAEAAVARGMAEVDRRLGCGKAASGKHDRCGGAPPQVALIALDPHNGEIKALVGGRNYAASQLNHVLAMRQPGSVFKPFVYAAALDTAVSGGQAILTPSSTVDDEPTTFQYGNKTYQPSNFEQHFMGRVTLRTALAHSLNVATVQVAQEVGLDHVVAMAHRFGIDNLQPTPALALGAYEETPLAIAGAYTGFANDGFRVEPAAISLVRGPDGAVLYQHTAYARRALDPRVNFLMVNMMEDVLKYGTGAGVRARGFHLPAAGKTGTSHDGWFAGFTSNLLCVVWVGFDDNRELNLEGAHSALPIWADFMKAATSFRRYHDVHDFSPPSGIVAVKVCDLSGEIAGEYCPNVRTGLYINGTQPAVECRLHGAASEQYADRVELAPDPASAPASAPAQEQQQNGVPRVEWRHSPTEWPRFWPGQQPASPASAGKEPEQE